MVKVPNTPYHVGAGVYDDRLSITELEMLLTWLGPASFQGSLGDSMPEKAREYAPYTVHGLHVWHVDE
jgi:hypothetical protein